MNKLSYLNSLEVINVLSDSKRLAILQLLMVKPRTISQIARQLGDYPAGIRHHINQLIQAGLVELSGIKQSPGFTEKYYSANAPAYFLQKIILPEFNNDTIVFMGSHDIAFEKITEKFEQEFPGARIFNLPIGSLDGLIALRQGVAHISGCHLFDRESTEYNSPFIKRIFPDRPMRMLTLAYRVQGLIFSAGNPKRITCIEDIAREDIQFINRNRGSGTRVWLDHKLSELGMIQNNVNGYTHELNSHTAVAATIKRNEADVGIGLIAAAVIDNLEFLPLFEEKYDLVIPDPLLGEKIISSFLEELNSSNYIQTIKEFEGYATKYTGNLATMSANPIPKEGYKS